MGLTTFQLRMKPVCVLRSYLGSQVLQEVIGDGLSVELFVFWTSAGWKGTGLGPSLVSFSQVVQKLQST